jgi:hypothetical protein
MIPLIKILYNSNQSIRTGNRSMAALGSLGEAGDEGWFTVTTLTLQIGFGISFGVFLKGKHTLPR